MNNNTRKLAVSDIIDNIERLNNTERDINDCYDYMCGKVFDELHVFFKSFDSRKQTRKKHKHSKPYWDYKLTDSFKKMLKGYFKM